MAQKAKNNKKYHNGKPLFLTGEEPKRESGQTTTDPALLEDFSAASCPTPFDEYAAKEAFNLLAQHLNRPAAMALLARQQGYSFLEIGTALGVSEASAYRLVQAAVAKAQELGLFESLG